MTRRRTPWPAGTPCWLDLATTDLDAVAPVYAEIFGWDLETSPPEYGGYVTATRDGASAAGIMPARDGQPSAWLVYIASEDADATAAAITEHGGTVVTGPMDIPDVGRFLVATDPTGATFGVWQHGRHTGAQITSEPGGLVWEHLSTPDVAAAQAFYGAVFGWVFHALPGNGFTFAPAADSPPLGSMNGLSGLAGAGAGGWMPLIAVDDCDRAVSLVTASGGSVPQAATDTPWGRQAILVDGAGAVFSVMESAEGRPVPER